MKEHKVSLIAGILLMVIGMVLCVASLAVTGFDMSIFYTVQMSESSCEVTEDFDSIRIEADTEDIIFEPSDGKNVRVAFFEDESRTHFAVVKDKTLTIGTDKAQGVGKLFFFSFNLEKPSITVYLPEGEYESLYVEGDNGNLEIGSGYIFNDIAVSMDTGDVHISSGTGKSISIVTGTGKVDLKEMKTGRIYIKTETGKTELKGITCDGDIEMITDTGRITLKDIKCSELAVKGDTSEVNLEDLTAQGNISIRTDTGNVRLSECDGQDITIKTTTGDVEGSLLSEKNFIADTDTGKVSVPDMKNGGICEITTDTGDISITVSGRR